MRLQVGSSLFKVGPKVAPPLLSRYLLCRDIDVSQKVPVPEHPLPAFCANPAKGELASPRLESAKARAIDLIMMVFV